MEPYERNKIADALQSSTYAANEIIIREGDIGDTFYIIGSYYFYRVKCADVSLFIISCKRMW
jgi:hypothetical protein